MKLRDCLLVCAGFGSLFAADPGLLQVRQVYLLPMGGGLDQYLANRLVASGRYTVVTDPKAADAILTDSLGTGFEDKYRELYPPPAPPAPPKPEKTPAKTSGASASEERSMVSMLGDSVASSTQRPSTFTRGRGNIFLVDRASRRVVWSTFLRTPSNRPEDLNRTADRIIDRMDDEAGNQEKKIRKEAATAIPSVPPPPPAAAPAKAPVPAPAPTPAPAAAPAKP